MKNVPRAPVGAAKLKTIRCPRAARLLKPCLSSTEVRPKAAVVKCVGYVHYAVGCVAGGLCAFVAVSDGMCCNLEEDLHVN